MNPTVTLGKMLRRHRIAAKLTQLQVSTALNYLTPQFVSNWERGISYPTHEALPTLARLFGVKTADLVNAIFAAKVLRELTRAKGQTAAASRKRKGC